MLIGSNAFAVNGEAGTKFIGVGCIECLACKETGEKIDYLRKLIHYEISKSLLLKFASLEDMSRAMADVKRKSKESLESWMMRVGAVVEIEKIVFATISENEKKYVTDKTARFSIAIRVMDVRSGNIEIIQSADTDIDAELDNIFINGGNSIARVYHGHSEITGKTYGSFTLSYVYPQGDLKSRGVSNGFGFNLNVYLTRPFLFLLTLGGYYFQAEKTMINSLFMFPLSINIPYYINISHEFKIMPAIGAGGIFSIMEYDWVYYRASGRYEYKRGLFFNPMITARIEANYLLYDRYNLILIPSFSYIVGEEGRKGYLYGLDAGLKITF
ncbi:MAG: hypothetical protein FWG49_00115 [Leptospirales bacterium]|nr:hypothetical protein [Leptospirales bacterium]